MPDSSELVKNIIYYQKSLDRYSQSREDTKILHCILKLYNMPVTVSHLEETGVGRTVNSLRKLGGEVEDAAKTLVRKWKQMVSGTDETEEPENNSEINSGESESNSSHKHSDRHRSNDRKERPNRDDRYKHNKKPKYDEIHRSTSESGHKPSSSRYNQQDEDRSSYESENEDDCESGVASESEQSSIEEEEEVEDVVPKSNKYENDKKHNDKYLKHKESSSERASKPKREPEKDRKSERSRSREKSRKHHEHEYRKQKRHNSSSSESSEQPPKPVHTSRDKSSSKRKLDCIASDEEVKKKMSKKSSPSTNDSHQSSNSHRSKESSHGYKKESKSEIDNYSSKSSSHKSKETSSSSSSNRDYKKEKTDSDKREGKNTSRNDSKNEKRKSESSRDDYSKSDEKSKKDSKSDKKSTDKEKSKSKHNSKNNSGSGSSTSTSSSSKIVDIGSESGTSFAEALGMLEPTTSKTNSKRTKSNETASYKQDKPERIKEKFLTEKPPKSDIVDILVPPPPPKSDIDINIASLLPSITTNYRPVYNPFIDNPYGRMKIMNDDEALSLVMSQKNLRTKVFSGNKCFFGTVPTLFELCIRVLQDNIDALEYTGGVPYVILKPVLDKATPEQLFMLEHHNPYLIEDSNEIWKFHCQKEFRNKKREEMESWRDMYMRCLDEREAKLKTLTENIKLSQVMSTPVRTAKLAYVDSVVKPPRDVIRKQAKSGIIDKKPNITPSARLSALATAGAAGQVVVPNPVRASSSGGSSAAAKPKKAPLMAKTLQFLKGNRFRR